MYKKKFKKRYKKKGTSLAKRIAKLEKKQKEQSPMLLKVDMQSLANIFTTPTVRKMNSVADRGHIYSFQLKGTLVLTEATSVRDFYRIVVFTDKSNEGDAIPGWTDVYEDATGIDGIISLRAVNRDKNEGQRFKVLYDKTFNLINDTDANIKDRVVFEVFKKVSIPTINGDGGVFFEKGGLYLAFVATSTSGVCDFQYNFRTRFINKNDEN